MDGQDENGKQVENVGLTFYVLGLFFTKSLKNYCLLSSRKFTLYLPFAIPGVILLREKVVNHNFSTFPLNMLCGVKSKGKKYISH